MQILANAGKFKPNSQHGWSVQVSLEDAWKIQIKWETYYLIK